MDRIKMLIADDMEAHRRRLMRILQTQDDFDIGGSFSTGDSTVEFARSYKPDIILMDIEMETPLAGIEAAKVIHETLPDTKIIVLTVHEDDNIVFAAFQTGIVDYVIKSATPEEIIEAIRSAYHDDSPIRPIIAKKLRNELVRIKKSEARLMSALNTISTLTPSELEILKLLCQSNNRQQIADMRSVEVETIKKQINGILRKFNVQRTKEVVKLMNELNIFEVIKSL
ncbi:response regulator transcription factor [Paenibacillus agaridevorans]|uniref:response regulator transcription factor n=1 Tax=Paenibacillus agaridevorans TaxID=171404 RepID=UPI001BE4C68F|nr:response regulator transcription factor [Paenibacillus agaridevorans]